MTTITAIKATHWDWRYNLLLTCTALAEILWIAPLIRWILILFDDPFPIPFNYWLGLMGANYFVGIVLRRVMLRRHLETGQQLPIMLFMLAVCVLVSVSILPILTGEQDNPSFDFAEAFDIRRPVIPNGIILTPLVFVAMWRGASIARVYLTPISVGILVRMGLLMIFVTTLLAMLPIGDHVAEITDGMLTILPIFFFASLLASALSRSAMLKLEEEVRQKRFGASWLTFLIVTALGLTGAGFVTAALLAGVDRETVLQVVQFPFIVLFTLLFIVASPFLYVADLGVDWLAERLRQPDDPTEVEIIGGERNARPGRATPSEGEIGKILKEIVDFLTEGVGIIVLVVIVGVMLFFWLSMLFPTSEDIYEEDRESIESREKTGGIRKAFARRLRKLGETLGLVTQFGIGKDLFAAFTIRWAYARMERMGKKRGYGRARSQTPYEYRLDLSKAFPGADKSIQIITEAYVGIRYGELPENDTELEAVRTALDHLKTIQANP